jgi:hypothetical protein
MTNRKFHNKDGTITAYYFGCGYVEKYGHGNYDYPRATISKEPNGYHVKGFDKDCSHFWEIFEKVRDARGFARKMAGKLKVKN